MAGHGERGVERVARKALLPVAVAAGGGVILGFFFPGIVGAVVPGQFWLVLSLAFFGSGLAYLALLPLDVEDDPSREAPFLLRIRHASLRGSLYGFFGRQDPVTFGVPVVVLSLFFGVRSLAPTQTSRAVGAARDVILHQFDWVFLGAMLIAVIYGFVLLLGPWGDIRLGGQNATPTYTFPTYFALVFTAGIAAGIVFWGPAEALFHYQTPPPFFDAAPRTDAAVVAALTYALFHWGVSAWSAYLVIGLPIAYYVYQRGAPLRVSSILTPFLGVDNLDGPWVDLVDVLAIFATVGGVATSVAFVSRQFLAGIGFQWDVSFGGTGTLLFVTGLVAIFVISAGSGVHRGIRRIAGVNLVLFVFFAALLFAVGPRAFVVDRGMVALASYAVEFVPMSVFLGGDWVANWTVWNWSWWFSWAPFAGLFMAALSYGRRVRTVVATGVLATSGASAVWFLLLGGTSLSLQSTGAADVLGTLAGAGGGVEVVGFSIFAALPLSQLLMFLFLALIIVFIVTSADTSTLVVSILATKREISPTIGSILFWGVVQGTVAILVLLTGGGETLQAAAVLTGGPFAVISLVALYGLTRTFLSDERGHDTLFRVTLDRYRAVKKRLADRGLTLPGQMPDLIEEKER